MKSPRNRYRTLSLMRDIGRRTEAPEGPIGCAERREHYDVRAVLRLGDVATAGGAVERGPRLALPVNELRTYRVVAVSGRWRERPCRLVEGEGEQIAAAGFVPQHALTPRPRFRARADAERRE